MGTYHELTHSTPGYTNIRSADVRPLTAHAWQSSQGVCHAEALPVCAQDSNTLLPATPSAAFLAPRKQYRTDSCIRALPNAVNFDVSRFHFTPNMISYMETQHTSSRNTVGIHQVLTVQQRSWVILSFLKRYVAAQF